MLQEVTAGSAVKTEFHVSVTVPFTVVAWTFGATGSVFVLGVA
jgi:hypothetical protein